MKFDIQLKDKEKVALFLENAPKQITKNMVESLRRALFEVERYGKMDAPVRTGRLRGDISTALRVEKDAVKGIVYNTVEYAPHVHEGTRYMRGRPYLRRAIQDKGAIVAKRELERNALKNLKGI